MRIKKVGLAVLSLALLLFLMSTRPAHLPSFLLPIPFLIIFVLMYAALRLLLKNWLFTKKTNLLALLGAGVPVILLILQSIGQLAPKDVITVLAFFVVSYFYVERSHSLLR